MRPTFLKLRNFKSIGAEAQTIDLAPITLLFGPNSAGKSSVLQSLIYLREVLVDRNYDADTTQLGGEWLDLGGFRNLVHGRKHLSDAIELELGFSLDGETLPDFLSDHEREEIDAAGFEPLDSWLERANSVSVKLSVRWSESRGDSGAPYVDSYSVSFDSEVFAIIASSADGKQVFLKELNLAHPILRSFSSNAEDEDAPDFQQLFLSLVSASVTTRATDTLRSLLADDRAFADKTLDQLEELISGAARGQHALLKKLEEELLARTSRRAASLLEFVRRELGESSQDERLSYIGLTSQTDALPHPNLPLRFDSSLWAELEGDEDAERNAALFHHLAESLISAYVVGPAQVLRDWLADFTYIGPLRDLPERNFSPKLSPDRSRWAKGLAAWQLLHQLSDRKIGEINFWLGSECLKTGYQVVVKRYRELPTDSPLFTYLDREMDMDEQLTVKKLVEEIPLKSRVILREEDNELEVMAQDIGVGISQLLPVVVLAVTKESGLLAIEQPELHIHPAIQVELADLFARYAIDHKKIVLLETHSEHLMLRLLRRIREQPSESEELSANRLEKDTVSVHYVQASANGTRFERLRIDDDGDFLDEWPNGFFDERDEELF